MKNLSSFLWTSSVETDDHLSKKNIWYFMVLFACTRNYGHIACPVDLIKKTKLYNIPITYLLKNQNAKYCTTIADSY